MRVVEYQDLPSIAIKQYEEIHPDKGDFFIEGIKFAGRDRPPVFQSNIWVKHVRPMFHVLIVCQTEKPIDEEQRSEIAGNAIGFLFQQKLEYSIGKNQAKE